jgi:hypothetical protein
LLSFMYAPLVSRFISIAALAAALFAVPAAADPWLLVPGDHAMTLGGSWFTADSYHDLDGTRHPLAGGGIHEEKALYSYNEFGWTKGKTLILGFPFQSDTRRGGAASAGNGATETGFGDLLLGVRFALRQGPTALSLEGDWTPPMGYDRYLIPRLGYGAQALGGRLQLGAPLGGRGFLELEGGYRDYIEKKSPTNQALLGATLGLWFGHSLLLAGNYQGAFSIGTVDTTGPNPSAKASFNPLLGDAVAGTSDARVSIQMAGPMLLYRVDEHLDLIVGSMHTASAKKALHVDRVYVAMTFKQTRLNRLQGILGGAKSP